jgi:hypothetical protein
MATLGALASDPVLIGGDNRSGTTLTSVVLDSHPDPAFPGRPTRTTRSCWTGWPGCARR